MSMMNSTPLERREVLRHDLLAQYARMLEIRHFEEQVNELFAQGEIHGTTHLCLGQEALAVGMAAELPVDYAVAATYRGHGVALALGMTPRVVLAEIMGRTAGCVGGLGGSMHLCDMTVGLLPTSAIIGAGIPIAAGAGLAYQNLGSDSVAVAIFGDGATNIGAFHEGLNLAAVWKLPVVFVIDNNVYGEYSRIDRTTPFEDLHIRAASYGMPGVTVDGMDSGAVQATLREAVARAKAGDGPTLIEAKTYRFAGHSRADTAPYRPEGELQEWQKKDPLLVTKQRLMNSGMATPGQLEELETTIKEELQAVIEEVRSLPTPDAAAMFTNIYADRVATV
jgi:TPP-dependent pyruvate/acetoin dehydrogenase alpha subunit